ncbi:MAG: ParB/RepB/Spo0J family partition protein [Clostridia bacterium]|nr:ParB/RepB/Spo0J family partition protein [Clostridia bacterium]
MAVKHRGLGKGLGALIDETKSASPGELGRAMEIPLDRLSPNPFQPRRAFDQAKIDELAESIRQHGVLQPIVVRPMGDSYQIIAGERRWRAAQTAGLDTIPVVVRDLDDAGMMQTALIENVQRENLNPVEKAAAYKRLMDEFDMTQEQLSAVVGVSRPVVANAVRLLCLPEEILDSVSRETMSEGHARCLLALPAAAVQIEVAKQVVQKGLSVRQTEELVKRLGENVSRETIPHRKRESDPDATAIAHRLGERLGTKVKISGSQRKGRLEIEYYSPDDLDRILDVILGTV